MPRLFDSYALNGVTLRNRVVASPMCQYMAHEGRLNEWHETHYTTLAKGGVGLVVLEATSVARIGRITLGDAEVLSRIELPPPDTGEQTAFVVQPLRSCKK